MAESEEFLREEEEMALESGFYHSSEAYELESGQFVSDVRGKNISKKVKTGLFGKVKSFGAVAALVVAMIVVAVMIFGKGNLLPDTISERLIEETDVQYADATQSKMIVFQQALQDGEVPDDTAAILKNEGVLVGYMNGGEFVEGNKSGNSSVLKMDNGEIVTADNFVKKANSDVTLYKAFNEATYSRAAYYYDQSAEKVFREIGTTRDNYTSSSDFDEVMDKQMGEGSSININTVSLVQKTRQNENGETETYYDYEENGASANSDAETLIGEVGAKNWAGTMEDATLNSADQLKVADTVSKEQRSSLFYLAFMENISKMKAGEGSDSKINEAMNYIYDKAESEVVDVKTGQVMKTVGTALESPSLYAVLSGNKMDAEKADNYSSDRILKTVENQLGAKNNATAGTVANASPKVKGEVGRFIELGLAGSSTEVLNTVSPTVSSSLMNNSYDTIEGVNAGEFLVEGAINVGKKLAKASGASAGDATAAVAYARLTSDVLAMDAAVDRMNRSPFDITSKNTFLGSIVYKMAVASSGFSGIFSGVKSFSKVTGNAVASILPNTYADEAEGYLTAFGNCETYGNIGAVGSAQCAEIATFDVSTLNDPYNNADFVAFVENNTTLSSSGTRTINNDSVLAKYITKNDERITPMGVMEGKKTTSILDMILEWLGLDAQEKRERSGEAFVNSSSNPDWQEYKWAQRYVSLARATEVLRQYSSDATAYHNIKYFEGSVNPVIAFLTEYYAINN